MATVTTTGAGDLLSTTADAPWPGGTVPAAGDDVIINHACTLGASGTKTFTCNSLKINLTKSLTIETGTSCVLNVATTFEGLQLLIDTNSVKLELNCPSVYTTNALSAVPATGYAWTARVGADCIITGDVTVGGLNCTSASSVLTIGASKNLTIIGTLYAYGGPTRSGISLANASSVLNATHIVALSDAAVPAIAVSGTGSIVATDIIATNNNASGTAIQASNGTITATTLTLDSTEGIGLAILGTGAIHADHINVTTATGIGVAFSGGSIADKEIGAEDCVITVRQTDAAGKAMQYDAGATTTFDGATVLRPYLTDDIIVAAADVKDGVERWTGSSPDVGTLAAGGGSAAVGTFGMSVG